MRVSVYKQKTIYFDNIFQFQIWPRLFLKIYQNFGNNLTKLAATVLSWRGWDFINCSNSVLLLIFWYFWESYVVSMSSGDSQFLCSFLFSILKFQSMDEFSIFFYFQIYLDYIWISAGFVRFVIFRVFQKNFVHVSWRVLEQLVRAKNEFES